MERIATKDVQLFETEHYKKVRYLGAECAVLLKSDGLLPLKAPCRAALFGNGVRHTVKGGTGSGDVNVRSFTTVEQGILCADLDPLSWNVIRLRKQQ